MHLVFDMDGVLLDSESDLSWLDRALTQTLRDLDLPITPENREALFPATEAAFDQFASQAGIAVEQLWETRDENYRAIKSTAITSGELQPYSDVTDLYSLPNEIDLHIISNSPDPVVTQFVTTNGYTDLFTTTLGRGSSYQALDKLKPHPHLFTKLTSNMPSDSGEYTYIGHTETDRRFAQNTQMNYLSLDRTAGDSLTTMIAQFQPPEAHQSSPDQ